VLCSLQGQIFIYHTIATFGAVVFATLMTTRQLLSIVLSLLAFGALTGCARVNHASG
jgi:adenosine 3'-phospho 5'-phosphosulfate transporter B2